MVVIREFVKFDLPQGMIRIGPPFSVGGRNVMAVCHCDRCGTDILAPTKLKRCWHCTAHSRVAAHLARLLPEDTTDCPRCGYAKPQVMARRRDRGGYRSMKCTECGNTWMQSCPLDAPVSCSRIFVLTDGRKLSLAQIAKKCRVEKGTIRTWLKSGLSADAILAGKRPVQRQKKKCDVTIRRIAEQITVKQVAESCGVSKTAIAKWVKFGLTLDEILAGKRPIPKCRKGRLRQVADVAGVTKNTVASWVKSGLTLEAILDGRRPEFRRSGKSDKRYVWDGSELTARECAELAGVSLRSMCCRLSRMPVDEALRVGATQKKHTLNGRPTTLGELAAMAGVTRSGMAQRLKRMSPEEAILFTPKREGRAPVKFLYCGESRSISELAVIAGVSRQTMERRLVVMPAEAAVAQTLHKRLRVMGRLYDFRGQKLSIRQIAELTGVPRYAIGRRLRAGQTIEEAVERGKQS